MIRAGEFERSGPHRHRPRQRLMPVPTVTTETMSVVPVDSEFILVDTVQGTIEGGAYTAEAKADMLAQLEGKSEAETYHLTVVYLPPLVPAEDAVAAILAHQDLGDNVEVTVANVYAAIQSGWIDQEGFLRILGMVAMAAQMPTPNVA